MDSSVSLPDFYQLGPFSIRGKENVLATADTEMVVLPKVMALLLYLCRHSQQVVTFDELNAAIWPREVVGDNAIYNLVGQLRKALGDNASRPTYIQTVSKVGYRLLIAAEPIKAEPIAAEPEALNTDVKRSRALRTQSAKKRWMSLAMAACLTTVAVIWLTLRPQKEPLAQNQRQLQGAYYQLYRGDGQGVDQAIDTLQKLVVIAPGWSVPKVELAYAFIRKARMEPGHHAFWMSKAQAISTDESLGSSGARLAALVSIITDTEQDLTRLNTLFSGEGVLTSARLAYSHLLFERGITQAAATQAQLALDGCMDCPYAYRQFAATQVVLGNVQEGFDSFRHYRMLVNRSSQNPADNAGYVPLTLDSLGEMANWHFTTNVPTQLLPHQRNALALFYLTLGQTELARTIVQTSPQSSTGFFDLYTHAAIAGARGDFKASYALLEKRQTLYPDNERFKMSVVYALWQLGHFEQAMQAFNAYQLLPQTETLPESLPFPLWSLYAALLLETGEDALGQQILAKLELQLRAGLLPGSQEGDIRLAEVLALQGRNQDALLQLETAINQGWVSDFNQTWWHLQDAPYFRDLVDETRFKRLVTRYHDNIAAVFDQASASGKDDRPVSKN